ncbi:hypothetical protein K458DRAFT_352028 [Lentithecium fluviatile CBS 122367]|uniref:Uncharacterized protein n=1 Tax=Lentithecium fluviatile CBS 122367 TaxID=1168545 RepID=A0A6G1IDY5_9PLEO|nr:hypothetical protein K458DRAFT_352028 [Lentithecium fluviatile CBS 122367]
MAEKIKIEFIGWEDDFRYAEEKRRISQHIAELAKEKGFVSATVQDMLIKHRYRAQGPWVDVHFRREDNAHVPARLWFNEDADFKSDPEFFDEVKPVA